MIILCSQNFAAQEELGDALPRPAVFSGTHPGIPSTNKEKHIHDIKFCSTAAQIKRGFLVLETP